MDTETQEVPPTTPRTVQVVARHPFSPTQILWVHNLLESAGTVPNIPMYGNSTKPPGWGFPGGGQEPDELMRLHAEDPNHPIFTNPLTSDEEKALAACGLREFKDESGYTDLSLISLPYDDEETGEPKETYRLLRYHHQDGHELTRVWGEITSLVRRPIRETDEIDLCDWFDVSRPLAQIFRNRITHPGYPYFSHIRGVNLALIQMDRWYRHWGEYGKCVARDMHPSWRLPFPFGAKDPRFPRHGYRIHYMLWYFVLEEMIAGQLEMIDTDFLYARCKEDIQFQVEREKEWESSRTAKQEVRETVEVSEEASASGKPEEEETDPYSGEEIAEARLQAEDASWLRWAIEAGIAPSE